tara:strand:- start:7134 stop:7961 length:828 start_codon:yes stop_codon:yes gene_type:complete
MTNIVIHLSLVLLLKGRINFNMTTTLEKNNSCKVNKKWCYIACSFWCLLGFSYNVNSQSLPSGFASINVYPYLSDVDNDSAVTLVAGTNLTPQFSYFGFVNIYEQGSDNAQDDRFTYFSEHNLRWRPNTESPWELTAQANIRTGNNNNRYRLGARIHLQQLTLLNPFFAAIHLKWAINFHALQFDHDPAHAWQIEHSYSMSFPYLSERLYLSGFIDHAINETMPTDLPNNPVVWETQIGYRLVDKLYLVSEYRINQYRRSDVDNLAVGLEYKFSW